MTDKPKLTLSNPKIKANPNSILSQNTEGISLTETLSQDKSNLQNSSCGNLSNKQPRRKQRGIFRTLSLYTYAASSGEYTQKRFKFSDLYYEAHSRAGYT